MRSIAIRYSRLKLYNKVTGGHYTVAKLGLAICTCYFYSLIYKVTDLQFVSGINIDDHIRIRNFGIINPMRDTYNFVGLSNVNGLKK